MAQREAAEWETVAPNLTPFSLTSRASRQVDGALVTVRWILLLSAWIMAALVTGTPYPTPIFGAWLGALFFFNFVLFVAVKQKQLPARLPTLGLIGDTILFGMLPYVSSATTPLLFLFALFPTLVSAMRFGAPVGALIAVLLALPYGLRAFVNVLPAPLHAILPNVPETDTSFFSAWLPILALFAAVVLVGYLVQREREAVVGDTAVELDQLRRAMAGAKLFYETTDALSSTLSYSKVLDAMLEAGANGMPSGRKDDPPPVGVVLLFEDTDDEKFLRVVAWRHLDRPDTGRRLRGIEGILAQALGSGDVTTFTNVAADTELSQLQTMRRCRAGVCYPLQAGLEVYGAVIFATATPRLPAATHMQLMKAFTNQAAVAFQNARLYQNLRAERDHIIDAEASARAKLARDLHDGPVQSLAALAMRLDYIRLLQDSEPEKAKQEFEQARASATRTGRELRELLFTLRPLTLETQGLSSTLQIWGQRLREAEGVPIDVNPGDFGADLEANLAGTVFAIVEEAVNNARKHAPGKPIHVKLGQQNGNLVATVLDEGPGFDVSSVSDNYDQRGSLGMVNMRERARLLDGHLSIESAPGRGTRVMLIVPFANRENGKRV